MIQLLLRNNSSYLHARHCPKGFTHINCILRWVLLVSLFYG